MRLCYRFATQPRLEELLARCRTRSARSASSILLALAAHAFLRAGTPVFLPSEREMTDKHCAQRLPALDWLPPQLRCVVSTAPGDLEQVQLFDGAYKAFIKCLCVGVFLCECVCVCVLELP